MEELKRMETESKGMVPGRIFLVQPFYGREEIEIFEERKIIEEFLRRLFDNYELEIIDQYHQIPEDVDANGRLFYLGNSIKMMETADMIVFAPDFRSARGCQIENHIAELYELPRLYLTNEMLEPIKQFFERW